MRIARTHQRTPDNDSLDLQMKMEQQIQMPKEVFFPKFNDNVYKQSFVRGNLPWYKAAIKYSSYKK